MEFTPLAISFPESYLIRTPIYIQCHHEMRDGSNDFAGSTHADIDLKTIFA
jgi:hypothetical protein